MQVTKASKKQEHIHRRLFSFCIGLSQLLKPQLDDAVNELPTHWLLAKVAILTVKSCQAEEVFLFFIFFASPEFAGLY